MPGPSSTTAKNTAPGCPTTGPRRRATRICSGSSGWSRTARSASPTFSPAAPPVVSGFSRFQVVSGFGSAPLPPVAKDELSAIGRTNDAILYGGRVTIWVQAEDDQLAEIGPKVPACASPDYGAPFASIFARYNHDFYKIDPMLFSPAEIVLCNLKTGRSFAFGRTRGDVMYQSFFA